MGEEGKINRAKRREINTRSFLNGVKAIAVA